MARKSNPHRLDTKSHYLYEVFTHKVVPAYEVLLEDVNNRFPGNASTYRSLKWFKANLKKEGVKIGKQIASRLTVPTPRAFATSMQKASKRARVELVIDLLCALGYRDGAVHLRNRR